MLSYRFSNLYYPLEAALTCVGIFKPYRPILCHHHAIKTAMNTARKEEKDEAQLRQGWLETTMSRLSHIEARPPEEWDPEKRRLYGIIENSLLRDERFRHLSILPPDTLWVYHTVVHNPRLH